MAVRTALGEYCGGAITPEAPAKGGGQPNGSIEEAWETVRYFVKILKGQLKENAKMEINSEDIIMQLVIRWVAMMTPRYVVGEDGKTGYERRRRRQCNIPEFMLGEKVWCRRIRENTHIKSGLGVGMEAGIWLGHARGTNETVIGTSEGAVRAYDIRPTPAEGKWDAQAIQNPRGTPGRPNLRKAGIEIPLRINVDDDKDELPELGIIRNIHEGEKRRVPITMGVFDKHGFTDGCEGCRARKEQVYDPKEDGMRSAGG